MVRHCLWKSVWQLVHSSIKPGCLSRWPLCHKLKSMQCSSLAAIVPQSKSTKLCSAAAVVPQSKSTGMWSSEAPFHQDWYFRHQTNEHLSLSFWFGKTSKPAYSRCHSSHWNQHTWPNYGKSYWCDDTHSTGGFHDALETCERCSDSK